MGVFLSPDRPPARLLWDIWKNGRIMSCEMNEHPPGWEICYYARGDFRSSQVFDGVARAETEAHEVHGSSLSASDRRCPGYRDDRRRMIPR